MPERITKKWVEIGGSKLMQFSANGESFIAITNITEADKIERFYQLCLANEEEICRAVAAQKEGRDWNHANPGKGRDWPAFRTMDKLRDRLCKEAGIKDT